MQIEFLRSNMIALQKPNLKICNYAYTFYFAFFMKVSKKQNMWHMGHVLLI